MRTLKTVEGLKLNNDDQKVGIISDGVRCRRPPTRLLKMRARTARWALGTLL